MTTLLHQRIRSKSIADVFQATEIEEDQEDLLPPGQTSGWGSLKSTLEKWKSNLVMNFQLSATQNSLQRLARSRTNSIFTRPPTHPHPRRQSLAEIFRRPVGLKDDIKKIWDRRPSLSGLKTHLKLGRSIENIPSGSGHNCRIPTPSNSFCEPGGGTENDEGDNEIPLPSFFVVDRSAWKLPS